MAQQGCDVVLASSSYSMPQRCSSCGMPQQTTRTIKKTNRQGNWRTTRSFQIPYCMPCAQRAQAATMKGVVFAFATLGVIVVIAGIGFIAPGIPAAISIGLPVVLSLVFAIVVMTALAPKPPALPAMAAGEAVKLVKFNSTSSTLYCANPHFGDELARANNVQPIAKSRSFFFGTASLWTAILGAPIIAGGLWFLGHPQVHIDNAGAAALQIWVDGKPSVVVKPNANDSIWIGHGKHSFGYSKEGAASPEGTIDADTTMVDAHLYNPQKTACYWLVADAYGDASVKGMQRGPQPIQEFYTFDKVDTWFADNPQSIEVDENSGGGTRVALQRATMCMELAEHGCSEADREAFVTCERAAKSEEALQKCADAVTCGSAHPQHTAAAGKGATPAPHASGHATPPHPAPAHSGKGK